MRISRIYIILIIQPVIRLLKSVIDAGKRAGIPVGVCGEMAGDIRALPIWLGLGIEELSISDHTILQVKHRLLTSDSAVHAKH